MLRRFRSVRYKEVCVYETDQPWIWSELPWSAVNCSIYGFSSLMQKVGNKKV